MYDIWVIGVRVIEVSLYMRNRVKVYGSSVFESLNFHCI